VLVVLLAVPAAASAATAASWNRPEQAEVVQAGLMSRLRPDAFGGAHPLTVAELRPALAALAARLGVPLVAPNGEGRVTVQRFDRILVTQLGLADIAAHVQQAASDAGLHPPARFGTEVVARRLGLRTNHPAQYDALELFPTDPITRAEAAHSLAVILGFGGWEVTAARTELSTFALPRYTSTTRRVLARAVRLIGMPYVWGGELDSASGALGGQVHGGYDCSGLVWRVLKVSGEPAGSRIRGRTAAQQAAEIPRRARVRLQNVRPGDLLFFGTARFDSRATERNVTHEGIALSNGWMIHSSAQGVFVSSLQDPARRAAFAWARRVLG
jgi:cell wall-associated NlpC family hydrolase